MSFQTRSKRYRQTTSRHSYPQFKIVCETENHFGYINLRPRKIFQNSAGYAEIDRELFKITRNRLRHIQIIESEGMSRTVYQRHKDLSLEPDMHWNTIVTLATNSSKRAIILFTDAFPESMPFCEMKAILGNFATRYFEEPDGKDITVCGAEPDTSIFLEKELQKGPRHRSYNVPHSEAKGSPIEVLFRDELKRHGIQFEEQVDVFRDNSCFTVLDFFIRSAGLAIYCDGIEFHNNPQRFISDRQQDRYLQEMGFNVYRFAGSEIVAHVDRCVNEVVRFMERKKPVAL